MVRAMRVVARGATRTLPMVSLAPRREFKPTEMVRDDGLPCQACNSLASETVHCEGRRALFQAIFSWRIPVRTVDGGVLLFRNRTEGVQ